MRCSCGTTSTWDHWLVLARPRRNSHVMLVRSELNVCRISTVRLTKTSRVLAPFANRPAVDRRFPAESERAAHPRVPGLGIGQKLDSSLDIHFDFPRRLALRRGGFDMPGRPNRLGIPPSNRRERVAAVRERRIRQTIRSVRSHGRSCRETRFRKPGISNTRASELRPASKTGPMAVRPEAGEMNMSESHTMTTHFPEDRRRRPGILRLRIEGFQIDGGA